jgi:hypothetical protein
MSNPAFDRAKALGWSVVDFGENIAKVDLADTDDHTMLEYYPATDIESEAFVMWYGGFESELLRSNQELKRQYNKLLKLVYDNSGWDRV